MASIQRRIQHPLTRTSLCLVRFMARRPGSLRGRQQIPTGSFAVLERAKRTLTIKQGKWTSEMAKSAAPRRNRDLSTCEACRNCNATSRGNGCALREETLEPLGRQNARSHRPSCHAGRDECCTMVFGTSARTTEEDQPAADAPPALAPTHRLASRPLSPDQKPGRSHQDAT